jgi:hypothetical protein
MSFFLKTFVQVVPRLSRKNLNFSLIFDLTLIIIIIIIIIDRGSRVRFLSSTGNFSLHHRVQNGSGAHPATYPRGTGGSFLGVKRLGCEADHSPPSSA